eukprot:3064975-Prorocentrum_lima.AAC.1
MPRDVKREIRLHSAQPLQQRATFLREKPREPDFVKCVSSWKFVKVWMRGEVCIDVWLEH